ncbi:amino acid adenylation domain-containing protein [Empedobacter sp. GD03797]|uniref:amino acid adenylation domain-containing protein n=1 Tax=Empedobacter sp. GD03797 TaxID=2975382 RepID=UPI00244A02AF|nr:amino acid adenylation domain-containing protein [Empedobacter sp. GD03797]MDH1882711.1 amino acid adenylation domain-containing protein [Empedobacter sp. GD03797]
MKVNLVEYFKDSVSKFPNHIALDDNSEKLTFNQVDELSNKIALEISKFIKQRNPIAVLLPKSNNAILSFIGIMKSGNFYIPLDTKSPVERIEKIISTLSSSCIITDKKHSAILEKINFTGKIIIVEQIENQKVDDEKLDDLSQNIIDVDPIYAIFTSGSTGLPKGVLISHRSVIDYIEWAKETYDITESDAIGNQAPFYFDNSTLDIYLMICTGATLNIIPEDRFTFPIKLIEYINEKEINFVFWVPSVLVNIANFDVFNTIKPQFLDKILFAGEAMPNKHLNYWRKNYPNSLYSNLYGPTEITVDCTFYNVERDFLDDESLPIGNACRNTQILIFNEENKITEQGELGELCVRGSSLSLGYYNDLEKTVSAFVQNPLHNNYPDTIYKTGDLVYTNELNEIIFVGRKDSQIKHMGYRIELGEIENAILGVTNVDNVAVLYDDVQKQIIAFVITTESSANIRKTIMNNLPKYMIPTRWEIMEEFPLNANGKINRLELKKLFN